MPIEETSATAEPEIPPKNIDARQFTCARPPRTRPIRALENAISRREIPPRLIISPESIKNGIAKSEKEFTPETMRCTIDISGILRYTAVTTEEAKRVNVIGTLKINKAKKLPIKINEAV